MMREEYAEIRHSGGQPGTDKLLEPPKLEVERLHVLKGVLERLVTTLAERFRDYCNVPSSFFVNQVESGNSWDVLESYEDSIAGIYYCRQWDSKIVIGLDRRFIFSLIDAAFGGDGSMPPFEADRPFTSLEARLARSVFSIVVPELEDLLNPITPVNLDLEKLETKLDFQILGQTDVPVIAVQILFQILDNGGRMFMIIPQSALYPIRKLLERSRALDGTSVDPEWQKKMQDGLASSTMLLKGVLEGPEMTLDEITALEPGQILRLDADTKSLIALECQDERLFWCRLAQSKSQFALVVEQPIDRQKELVADLISSSPAR
ncbi:MAG: flagellar motor switch protein FliM [Hyphomicrobium zavarzinii]|jgi:flagellar motor switch protein FliM|uniref:flagellar motor switch protein FliM n=1 Tax=Hyphomicrobium TaxID=81 RepID=UPI001A606740|nr:MULTISPECIES: flagellar motor switch protein FliM [Hyphomicrobium]MBL8847747.1 flagellar motor switch protein FliM [Hyphomicrobium zavarzinii]WBT39281.1 flagellar motor switch protein FliM [Hyphomicrobium sp. DMF-1]HML41968.1 flagellar motor switch protein FliM [Hyphomicrobium zavarzinii]